MRSPDQTDRNMKMADTTFGPNGWTPERLGSLRGKTYLITGATAGAGFQAARVLLTKGAKVVMLNRSVAKSQRVVADLKQEVGGDVDLHFIRMDSPRWPVYVRQQKRC